VLAALLAFAAVPARATAVDTADGLVLRDSSRGRDIALKVYFPREPGKFPVVIFSHRLGGSKDGYEYLGRYWAEHGYARSTSIIRVVTARSLGPDDRS